MTHQFSKDFANQPAARAEAYEPACEVACGVLHGATAAAEPEAFAPKPIVSKGAGPPPSDTGASQGSQVPTRRASMNSVHVGHAHSSRFAGFVQWQMHAAIAFGCTVMPEFRYTSDSMACCTASATEHVSTRGRHVIMRVLPAQKIFFFLYAHLTVLFRGVGALARAGERAR